jgi:hypothetical protein
MPGYLASICSLAATVAERLGKRAETFTGNRQVDLGIPFSCKLFGGLDQAPSANEQGRSFVPSPTSRKRALRAPEPLADTLEKIRHYSEAKEPVAVLVSHRQAAARRRRRQEVIDLSTRRNKAIFWGLLALGFGVPIALAIREDDHQKQKRWQEYYSLCMADKSDGLATPAFCKDFANMEVGWPSSYDGPHPRHKTEKEQIDEAASRITVYCEQSGDDC